MARRKTLLLNYLYTLGATRMASIKLLSIALLLLAGYMDNVWADSIYKCMNAAGVLIYSSSLCAKEVKTLSSWDVVAKPRLPSVSVLKQDISGHYRVDGSVNGQNVNFVVDTGATSVSLPSSVADNARMDCKQMVEIQTANGKSQACRVSIDTLKFGAFELKNVDGVIAPNLTQPLLGMNVLKQYKIAQEHDEMRIMER